MKNRVIALAEVVSRQHSGGGVSSTAHQRADALESLRKALVTYNEGMVRCSCVTDDMQNYAVRKTNIGVYGPDQNYGEPAEGGYADLDCPICGGHGRV